MVVISMLIALLLPAVSASRESARRMQCANNLSQLGVALASYEVAHTVLPPGVIDRQGPIRNVPLGYHMSWTVQLMPYLEQAATYARVDFSAGVYDLKNRAALAAQLMILSCPSSHVRWSSVSRGTSSYAACHHDVEAPIDTDNHGVFFLNSYVRSREIPDGAGYTIYLGEKGPDEDASTSSWSPPPLGCDFGWMSGTRSTLRDTGTPLNGKLSVALKSSTLPGSPTPPSGVSMAGGMPILGGDPSTSSPIIYYPPEEVMVPSTAPGQLLVGGFGSYHTGVANFLFGDGAVRAIAQTIDLDLYRRLGHRADGQLIEELPP
jgi:prepilin-type processing-associated H-X9-DG protein